MALFDTLKNQTARAAHSVGDQAAQNPGQTAWSTSVDMGNKTYTVTLRQFPVNLAQMQAMPEACLKEPQHTAALRVSINPSSASGKTGVSSAKWENK